MTSAVRFLPTPRMEGERGRGCQNWHLFVVRLVGTRMKSGARKGKGGRTEILLVIISEY